MMPLDRRPRIDQVIDGVEYAKILMECKDSVSQFAKDFLGLTVFDYNRAFLDCMERFIVYRTGRQVGKSRNTAIKAIHFGYFAPFMAKNLETGICNIVVASISKDQAFLIFNYITAFIHRSSTLSKHIKYETKTSLQLAWFDGGGVTNFIVRPIGDTGDSLRGFTTHFAVIDEAAHIPQKVFDAFLPSTVTTKPIILFTSTPKGKAGAFFNACEHSYVIYQHGVPHEICPKDDKHQWVQFHVTTKDNPLASSDPAIMSLIENSIGAKYKQEVMGEFLDQGNSLISYNLLMESLTQIQRPRFAYYDLGVDTSGKGADETVCTTVGVTESGLVCPIDVYTEQSTDQIELAKKIDKLDSIYHYRHIFIDGTAIGDTLSDACKHQNSMLPVYPINFTGEKTDLYVNLARLFETPLGDMRIINLSLLQEPYRSIMTEQIQYMYWDYGLHEDQPPRARSEHQDDYSDSLALACYGQRKGDFISVLPDELLNEW